MRTVVIGLGGIGTCLIDPLCRMIAYADRKRVSNRLVLVDGDQYEEKNRERQRVGEIGINKAVATTERLKLIFGELEISSKAKYVDEDNSYVYIREGDVVLACVDNHATRKVLSDCVGMLKNGLLISGGNDEYDGNIQVYERRDGKDVTPPLTAYHREIGFPKDRNPAHRGCDELIEAGSPQILTVNLTIAALMLNALTLWSRGDAIPFTEQYFDLKTGNVRPVKRKVYDYLNPNY